MPSIPVGDIVFATLSGTFHWDRGGDGVQARYPAITNESSTQFTAFAQMPTTGEMAVLDMQTAQVRLYVFNGLGLTSIDDVAFPSYPGYFSDAEYAPGIVVANGKFFVCVTGDNDGDGAGAGRAWVLRIAPDGTLEDTFTLPGASVDDAVDTSDCSVMSWAVSPDGTILYYSAFGRKSGGGSSYLNGGDVVIHAYDLVGDAPLADFATIGTGDGFTTLTGAMCCLPSGNLLVACADGLYRLYNSSGSLLDTWSCDLSTGSGLNDQIVMGDGANEAYWELDQTVDGGVDSYRLTRRDGMDGSAQESFAITPVGTYASNGLLNYVHVVIRDAITVPATVPLAPPAAPQAPCAPQATVHNGGKGASGCNVGGIGFTPSYSGPYGTVPQHDDPDDGETLTGKDASPLEVWVELVHTDYPSDEKVTHRRAFEELADDPDYEGGRKPAGLLSVGTIEHSIGNEQGGFEAASGEIVLSDARERIFATLADDQELDGDEVYVKAATDAGRAAGIPPRVLMRGIVQRPELQAGLQSKLSFVDWLFSDFGPFGPDSKWPRWVYGDLGAAAPDMTADTKTQCIQSLFGEKTDAGPSSGHAKGLIPFTYLGMFDLAGLVDPVEDTPGTTLEALVAQLQASVDAGTTVADWGGHIGNADAQALQDLGTVPNDYTRLAGIIGQGDLDNLLAQGTTTHAAPTTWAFLSAGLGPWHSYTGVYGSDLGHGDAVMTHDRVQLDLNDRADILVPGYQWPTPGSVNANVEILSDGVRFTNPDTGKAFVLTGIFVCGPLLNDHLSNTVTIACNAIGRVDPDGNPVMHSERVKQYWLENDLLINTRGGLDDLATDEDYPVFNDGVPMVRSSSFDARQDYLDTQRGDPFVVSWYVDQQQSTLEVARELTRSTESPLGVGAHGQIIDWGFDPSVTTSTWPRISHVTDVFGSIVRSAGQERENVITGSCDWDSDSDKFRAGPFQIESAAGIQKYKGRRKQGDPINSMMLNDLVSFAQIGYARLARLEFGMTTVEVTGPRAWMDYDVGQGVRFTSEEGPGANGYVDHPFLILRRQINIAEQLVTFTLWDVRDLLT